MGRMSRMTVPEGPHGLVRIDVYGPPIGGYDLSIRTVHHTSADFIVVRDARDNTVADAICRIDDERKEAAAWLLDFATISADGR